MKISPALRKQIDNVTKEKIDIVSYNPHWKDEYQNESSFLITKFPDVIKSIVHLGSTSVPGLSAKPIIDIFAEVTSYKDVKEKVVPLLTELGYEYFWRPEFGDKPPMYAWFIKRNSKGNRTHHIHMFNKKSKFNDRIAFRDYLESHKNEADRYASLKYELAVRYPNDREGYTKAKTQYIKSVLKRVKNPLND